MNEAFICDFVRTPIGRYEGGLARVRTDDLAATAIRDLIARNGAVSEAVDEVILGCANQAGEDNRNVARMALLLAGLPAHVPGVTINRLCASGLDAVAAAARAIRAGEIDLAVAGGVESMTRAPFVMGKAERAFQRTAEIYDTTIGWRFVNAQMKAFTAPIRCRRPARTSLWISMCRARTRTRSRCVRSNARRAPRAPACLPSRSCRSTIPQAKGAADQVIERDEQLRPETTLEGLAKLKPVVRAGGTVTAGNASTINDGAAALLLASARPSRSTGCSARARVMALRPPESRRASWEWVRSRRSRSSLNRLRLKISDFDVIELNEAFASQALACVRAFGLADDAEHVNSNGGAIALGHPLGMSGARIAGAAVQELLRRSGRYGLAAMCVGVGQGAALAFERA